jgi:hypothetical protein
MNMAPESPHLRLNLHDDRRLAADRRDALVSIDDTMTRRSIPDLLPGTLDLLILRTLQTQPLHGWAIAEWIEQISADVLQVNQGSLHRHSIASVLSKPGRTTRTICDGPATDSGTLAHDFLSA